MKLTKTAEIAVVPEGLTCAYIVTTNHTGIPARIFEYRDMRNFSAHGKYFKTWDDRDESTLHHCSMVFSSMAAARKHAIKLTKQWLKAQTEIANKALSNLGYKVNTPKKQRKTR